MLILKSRALIYKYSWFAQRKCRSFKFRVLRKLRKIFSLPQPEPFAKGFSLPSQLENIPFTDAKVTNVSVRNVLAPYNASIVEHGNKFLLFFRYDQKGDHAVRPYYTHIGCVELDEHFRQTDKEYLRIDTKSRFSEDPRILKSGSKLFLSYNDFLTRDYVRRSIHLASLHPETLATEYITNLHIAQKPIEKNWTPFIHGDELHFDYYLTPRQVLKIPNPQTPHVNS
jgi:hypothetical protein